MAAPRTADPFVTLRSGIDVIRGAALEIPSSDALASALAHLAQFEQALPDIEAALAQQGEEAAARAAMVIGAEPEPASSAAAVQEPEEAAPSASGRPGLGRRS